MYSCHTIRMAKRAPRKVRIHNYLATQALTKQLFVPSLWTVAQVGFCSSWTLTAFSTSFSGRRVFHPHSRFLSFYSQFFSLATPFIAAMKGSIPFERARAIAFGESLRSHILLSLKIQCHSGCIIFLSFVWITLLSVCVFILWDNLDRPERERSCSSFKGA